MKKILSLSLFVSMSFAANADDVENHIAEWGQLKLVGNQLSSETGDPIQLKGWSTFSLHYGEVQGCLGESNWKMMHKYGANVVRLSMYVNTNDTYLSSPAKWKSIIKKYITELAAEGMYGIVDWHLINAAYNTSADPNEYTETAKDFFGEISEYCADNGYKHVLYEICNEPDCDWENVKKYAKEVIPAILKYQPNAMVIVDTDKWSQNIMSPVSSPLNEFKNNVLYSFHYYAGTDYNRLGEFRNAQKFIPVIASEWSTVRFDGNGPNNLANGDAFLEECTNYNGAPQLVSWCFWNWGRKNEASSTFLGVCSESNLSKSPLYSGEYIVNAMTSEYKKTCENCGPYEVQNIPNTESKPWRWEYYNLGGEGYAYHDKNSSAYKINDFGDEVDYIDYAIGDESDAFSLAYTLGLMNTRNPFYVVEDGNVTEYMDRVQCSTADGKITYKSLNAGKTYCGVAGSGRPDEGVDLLNASLLGTKSEKAGYNSLFMIEDGEWINYTVNVAKPGYYKVQAYVSGNHSNNAGIAFYQKNGNIIRPMDDLSDYTVDNLYFNSAETCADPNVSKIEAPWDCWSLEPAMVDRRTEAVLEFKEAGVQELGIRFVGNETLEIGPLVFTYMEDVMVDFTVSPNPTYGSFTVTLDNRTNAKVEVKDADNKIVYSGEITKYKTIDENLAPGTYTVVVTSEFGAVSTKNVVVKEKPENYVSKWGQLKLVGNQLSSATGEPIQLKGWSTFSLHYGEVQGCLGENYWKLMHQYGANVVRLTMYVTEPISYLSDPDSWKKRIKDYIKELAAEGMYCIVDWHLLENGAYSADPNKFTEEAKDFFGEISEYCKDNSYKHVLYEICNEPACDWNNVKKYAKEVIPVILKNQPNAMVIVDTDSWSQNIMNPVTDPLDEFKKNVLYSFHYYAGSDYHKLGEFRNAQKFIPVIASEWSTVKFDGNGPNNFANGDAFLEECTNYNGAPQLVSWCFWSWGSKNEPSSAFTYECSERNLSKSPYYAGEYIVNAMTSEYKKDCKNCGPYEVQSIPNTAAKPWRWDNFDFGGEGYAYHDKNSSAYEINEYGDYVGYAIGDECDAYSWAFTNGLLDKPNPYYTVVDGKITSYNPIVECTADGKITYKSLNAGKTYCGVAGSGRPDDGVDLFYASLLGTELEKAGYTNLDYIEDGEWINYTVDVKEPGYYKLQAYVSGDYTGKGGIAFYQKNGNIIRSLEDLSDLTQNKLHFKRGACADPNVLKEDRPWDCWSLADALDDYDEEAVLEFKEAGVQELAVRFFGKESGIGPLVFTSLNDIALEFTVSPNPTFGSFTVTLDDKADAKLEVKDADNKVVYSGEITKYKTIDENLAPGTYTVVVTSAFGAVSTKKVVVKEKPENYVSKWGQLKLVGNQLSSETGDPIQLKGWSTFSLHYGEVQGCLGKNNWTLMHQYGANVVRLTMYVTEPISYLSDPDSWKKRIKDYIKELAAEGMYCIVDWHLLQYGGNSADPNKYTEEAKDFFGEISEYCADNGYKHVLYEICNEPDCDWNNVKKYAKEVIPAILKNQPNAMVIVDTDNWSQNIMNPVTDPLNEYKKNVLYSFHYYAGTDFHKLGEFRNAQKFIPVIASDWSTVKFDGNGPNNFANGDAFLEECTNYNGAPQLVSWCFWNWGKKNEPSSAFTLECSERNLSKSPYYAGEYIVNAMTSEYKKDCKNCEPYEVQSIPNTAAKPWRWENYDFGGEGYAYHDKNSSAYVFDKDGEIVDYSVGNDESDAYSWAYTNGILSTANPYYTVVDGKITSYDGTKVGCTADGKSTYKSLNGGKTYCGVAGSGRPDEGVDLFYATMKGTGLENKGYTNVDLIEDGEWINYTVDVAEPGYYKVQAYVTSDYKGEGDIAFYQKNGSVIRPADDLSDLSFNKLHFMQGEDCADSDVDKKVAPWDCWSLVDAVLGDTRRDEVVLEFKEAGVQTLGVRFIGTSAGIGPLVFTNMKDVALEFTVSPNSTYGSFTVTLADRGDAKLEVKDADGKVVYSGDISRYKTIDENLAPGEYTVVVTSAFGAVSTKKVVVKEKPENYVSKWGQLKIVGNQLSSENGDPIQLKGWSTFSLHYGEVQGCLGEDNWKLMHQYGANVVRLSMYVNESNSYLSNPDSWKERIKNYIDELAAEGMYCIVDWHLIRFGVTPNADPNKYTEEAKDFFGEISEYCNDRDYKHVLYEICNEPDCEWDNVKIYAGKVIPVILKNQPNAMVIVDTDSWSQNIMNAVSNPLVEFKSNVLYSFHYYAGTDYHKMGEFRNAQKFIPVIASEWSATRFDGNGPINEANSDAFLEECTNYNGAPQLVSWCFWNWGRKDDYASTFIGICSESNLSKSPYYAGEYIVKAMTSEYQKEDCINCIPYEVERIPNTKDKPLRWENYDFGGEGYAYHDKNSSAYVFDRDGEIVDYSVGNDESDAYSWAYTNGILSTANPYYTVVDGKITSYDGTKVGCTADGKSTYKSLNGGKTYCGVAGSGRPDEGVDLFYATLKGTGLENKGYTNVDLIEDGEWINYTVDVAEPGYYKVQAYVTSDYKGEGEIAFYQKNGSVIRPADDLSDLSFNKLHFMQGKDCADSDVDKKVAPWDCWSLVGAALEGTIKEEAVLEFKEAGVQTLGVRFIGTSAGIGPLVFTNMKDIKDDDDFSYVDNVISSEFDVYPNPTSGEFTVTLAKTGKAIVEITNATGQIVYSAEVENSVTINKTLAAGVYTVVVKFENGISAKKLVVK